MSGPKCYSYSVESEAERLARQTRAATARCDQLAHELESANRECVANGVAIRTVPEAQDESLEALEARAKALDTAVSQAREAVREARAAKAWASMRQAVANVGVGKLELGLGARPAPALSSRRSPEPVSGQSEDSTAAPRSSMQAADQASDRLPDRPPKQAARRESSQPLGPDQRRWGQLAASVERALESASRLEDPAVRDALAAQAAAALEASELSVAESRRTQLVLAVGEEARRQETAARCRREAQRHILGLAHIVSAAADELRQEARAVTSPDQVQAIEYQAARLLEAERAREDAAFVADQTRAVLESMGYAVDAPPTAGPHQDTALFAYRDDLPDHVLTLRVDGASASVATQVIACGATTGRQDIDAEEATCEDLDALSGALWQRGVAAERVSALGVGAVPLERDDSLRRADAPASASVSARTGYAATAQPGAQRPAQPMARERRNPR
ncbi:MAG: hypothetical protein LBK95_19455 [Bifidobacteriaceae bacterium]|jgi:hypothetical protein|nr:hypothetical protein [Bifidobacteriaceae bacterium]